MKTDIAMYSVPAILTLTMPRYDGKVSTGGQQWTMGTENADLWSSVSPFGFTHPTKMSPLTSYTLPSRMASAQGGFVTLIYHS